MSLRRSLLAGAAIWAVSPVIALAQDAVAPVEPAEAGAEQQQRRDINPYDRDIEMTAPLQFNQRILGELPIILTRDDNLLIDSRGFIAVIGPLLTPEALQELQGALATLSTFSPAEIYPIGIRLEYDPGQLAILVLRIDPHKRSIENIYQPGRPDAPGLSPEQFSAYLNTNLAFSRRSSEDETRAPSVFLDGAIRFGSLVLEADFQGREDAGDDSYNFDRQYARLVYDQPEAFRRWIVGDLDPETRGRQGFVQMGGIGVMRRRQRFDSYRTNALAGNRQLVLQEDSTVRVMRNGVFQREFVLDAGQYDLSNLPLETGSNDIQLEIVNRSGRTETVSYSAYLDVIDLEPGDYEYGAFLGVTGGSTLGSPDYGDGDPVFTGFWRKAFLNAPAIGLGFQASEAVQTVTGQTQFILPNGARLRLDAAASNADAGTGYAFTASFEHFVDRGLEIDSWAVSADYTSEDFANLGNDEAINPASWIFSGSYTRRFNERWTSTLVGSYRMSRTPLLDDVYSVTAFSNYRISDRLSTQVGLEYVDYGNSGFTRGSGFGISVALVWQPFYDQRVEGRYNSARNSGSVRYSRMTENRAGAIGYSLASSYDDGPGSLSGQIDYAGNRFDASLSHAAYGSDFGSIGDQQVTTLRLGSSIAVAGGHWGVGRNIYDSFAVVYPHRTLDSPVIVGDSLDGGYVARSGAFGGALANNLVSYVNQAVRYDAIDPPVGYDTGAGVTRVFPSYRSGYAIEVGRADFVSATGRLLDRNGEPASLLSGRVVPVDDPAAEPALFFTNTGGRFAMQNLTPGRRYRVDLPALERSFEFTVPEDSEGLLDLHEVRLSAEVPR